MLRTLYSELSNIGDLRPSNIQPGKPPVTWLCVVAIVKQAAPPGNYGAIVNWFHLECARADETLMAYAKMGEVQLGKRVLGVEAMTKEELLGSGNMAWCWATSSQVTQTVCFDSST